MIIDQCEFAIKAHLRKSDGSLANKPRKLGFTVAHCHFSCFDIRDVIRDTCKTDMVSLIVALKAQPATKSKRKRCKRSFVPLTLRSSE